MIVRRLLAVGVLGAALFPAASVALPCAGASAQAGAHHAGLVVTFPDASVKRYCVAFTEAEISGYELLRRSGLALGVQDNGGGSIAVCSIDGLGCSFPKQPCFCRCATTSECTFWGYYTIDAGQWRFQSLGAGARMVRDGDVDGWRWGRHGTGGANPPRSDDLDAICAEGVRISAAAADAQPSRAGGSPALAYVLAGSLLAALAAGLIVRGRTKRREGEET